MDFLSSKIKIKDIAEKAGVSTGTVDRVLHDRGNVSEETKKKVQEALDQLDYTPNLYASALASKKIITLLAVIPVYNPGEYWEKIEAGLLRASRELSDFKIRINIHYFDQFDSGSFVKTMEKAIAKFPDGILLAPSLKPVTLEYTRKMDQLEIPYVFIDSRVEGANPLAYYGQDSMQSGYLGAKLLFSQKPELKEVAVFSFLHTGQMPSNQISLRMEGFNAYAKQKQSGCKIHTVDLDVSDFAKDEKMIKELFLRNPEIGGAVIFSSRSYMVAEFLKKQKLNSIAMIGYDLLKKNIDCLKNNMISYLIAQRPEEQAYKGVKALSDHLIFKKQVQQINFTPIDILTQENIDFYSEF